MKRALIFGITGQDGSYLAEVLIEKHYEVHGVYRRSATGNTRNIEHLLGRLALHKGDLADTTSIYRIIRDVAPDEIYNEADQDHVSWSFATPDYSSDITGAAVGRMLEIVRQVNPSIRFFQPCTSNMFGKAAEFPQTETTPFHPQSPYACSKILAYYLARYYREAHGMFVSTAILYNHESPRRTEDYVTRKITRAAARISLGLQDTVELGDLGMKVDWGYAREYMEAAWSILQLERADDFIIATGETHSVREWLDEAFAVVNLNPSDYVRTNPSLIRPATTSVLLGNATKAQRAFGFNPEVRFKGLVRLMVEADLNNEHASLPASRKARGMPSSPGECRPLVQR
jgi:GDPmannose 4,6-dehydratase